jgi:hypothetical protein
MTVTVEPLSWMCDATDPVASVSDDRAAEVRSDRTPVAFECLSADSVDGIIADVQEQLQRLRRELADCEHDAAVVEGRLAQEGIDPDVAIIVARAVPRLLADLREEAEERALATLAGARAEARAMRRSGDPRSAFFEARVEHWRRLVAPAARGPQLSWRPPAPSRGAVLTLPAQVAVRVPDEPTEPAPAGRPLLGLETTTTDELEDLRTAPLGRAVADELEGLALAPTDLEPLGDLPGPNDEDDIAEDFWARVDEADARRSRWWSKVGRAGALRAGAVACVGVALLVHFV